MKGEWTALSRRRQTPGRTQRARPAARKLRFCSIGWSDLGGKCESVACRKRRRRQIPGAEQKACCGRLGQPGQGLGASPFSGWGGTLAGKVGGLGRRRVREFPSPLHLDLMGVTEETTSVPEPSVLREDPGACLASHPAPGPGEAQSPWLSQGYPRGRVWANAPPMTPGPGQRFQGVGGGTEDKGPPSSQGPQVRATYGAQGWPAFWGDFILCLFEKLSLSGCFNLV